MNLALQNVNDYYRYCPGEERAKLSNAICFGRRRTHFPKCKGCQFNDDEKNKPNVPLPAIGQTAEDVENQKRRSIDSIFKSYDVRGLYPDELDAEFAWRIGQATAQFLRSELRGYDRSQSEKSAVIVGRDMRPSSLELQKALMEGLRAGGSAVIDIGLIDTPQLYFATNHFTCCGGVQVTASHNPLPYNGFKFCGQKGKPVGSDTGLGKICKIAKNTARHSSGQLAAYRQEDLFEPYRKFVRGFLKYPGATDGDGSPKYPPGYSPEQPFRVVVDASNGMAGRWFPLLFEDIDWLEIVPLNFEHNGEFVHDPNPLVPANLAQLKDRMVRSKGKLGVCFDGDADRCVFVDAKGRPVRADIITALLANEFLKQSAASVVVYDLRCSRVVAEEIRNAGGIPRRERCGHTYLKKALADSKAVFGGELSGHYYFRDNWYCDSGMIAFIHVLNLLAETGKSLQQLIGPLQRYAHSGERNFKNENIDQTIQQLADRYADGQIDFLDGITVQYPDWWFNVRPSNTEPLVRLNLEAKDDEMLDQKLKELVPLLGVPVK